MKKKINKIDSDVISIGEINDISNSFAENEVAGAEIHNPIDNDTSKILISVEETIKNQRINSEKDKQVMDTLEDVLNIKEQHVIGLKDYFSQLINILLNTTNYAYRRFTLAKDVDYNVVLPEKIMHIINAITLGVINEIEFVNPISLEIQPKDGQMELSYKLYVEMVDNLNSGEIIGLFPCISARWNYINCICAEYCFESSLTIKGKQLEIKYNLPTYTIDKTTLKSDPFSNESREAILYYLDMFTY